MSQEEPRVVHCWTGKRDAIEAAHPNDYQMRDDWAATWNGDDGTCMLLSGHEGDHEFTPDSQIGVQFVPTDESS